MAEPESLATLAAKSYLQASSDPSIVSTEPSTGTTEPDPVTNLAARSFSSDPSIVSTEPDSLANLAARSYLLASSDPSIVSTEPSTGTIELDVSTVSMDPSTSAIDVDLSTVFSAVSVDPSTNTMDPSTGRMDPSTVAPSTDTVAPLTDTMECHLASSSNPAVITSESLSSTTDSNDCLKKIAQRDLLNLKTKEMISVQSLWSEGDVVILFVRWFGCIMARYEALKLGQIKELLESNGIKVVIVGFYEKRNLEFMEKFWSGDSYLDASRNCYKDLQFKSYSYFGIMVATASAICQDLLDKAEAAKVQYAVDGEGRQNGGLLVVKKKPEGDPELALLHIEKYPGHRVLNRGILKALGITKEKAMESMSEESVGCLEYEEPELPPDLDNAFADLCDQVTEIAVVRSIVGDVPIDKEFEMDMLLRKY